MDDNIISQDTITVKPLSGSSPSKQKESYSKSSAQVAPFVLPHKKASELKLKGSTKNGSTKRPTPLAVRLTEAQKLTIRERAQAADCNVNEYIRTLVLSSTYKPPLPKEALLCLLQCKMELTRQSYYLSKIIEELSSGALIEDEALQRMYKLTPSMTKTQAAIDKTLTNGREYY